MTSFWTQLEEENTVNPIILARALSALNKLECDVGNHAVALHEKRHSLEHELWSENTANGGKVVMSIRLNMRR